VIEVKSQEHDMKANLAVMAVGAFLLMPNAADTALAQTRIDGQTHARSLRGAFGRADARIVRQAPVFRSASQPTQWFPNPDRGPFPMPCSGASC
jgi:hypothetical protein